MVHPPQGLLFEEKVFHIGHTFKTVPVPPAPSSQHGHQRNKPEAVSAQLQGREQQYQLDHVDGHGNHGDTTAPSDDIRTLALTSRH